MHLFLSKESHKRFFFMQRSSHESLPIIVQGGAGTDREQPVVELGTDLRLAFPLELAFQVMFLSIPKLAPSLDWKTNHPP